MVGVARLRDDRRQFSRAGHRFGNRRRRRSPDHGDRRNRAVRDADHEPGFDRLAAGDHGMAARQHRARLEPPRLVRQLKRRGQHRVESGTRPYLRDRFARIASISSITRFISFIVRSRGSSVVMSTPASFSRSIGYLEPPELMKAR